jgi:hypothetical protein
VRPSALAAISAFAALCSVIAHSQTGPSPLAVEVDQPSAPTIRPAQPAPPPSLPRAQAPRLRSASRALVTSDDYPPAALRAEEEGRVSVILSVGFTGLAGGCFVNETSGSERLDLETCRILMRRTRYVPATDDTGAATLGEYRHAVVWRLPDPEPVLDKAGNLVLQSRRPLPASGPTLPAPIALTDLSVTAHSTRPLRTSGDFWGTLIVRLTVGLNGRVEGCEPVGGSYPDFNRAACDDYRETARFSPAVGPDNRPVVSSIYAPVRYPLPARPVSGGS